MGKGYVENSLKRFLKRKVKITLGVVVSFLITGMVVFADPVITGQGVYIPYDSWVAGIGQEKTNIEKGEIQINDNIFLKRETNGNTIINISEKEVILQGKNISFDVINKSNEALKIAEKGINWKSNLEYRENYQDGKRLSNKNPSYNGNGAIVKDSIAINNQNIENKINYKFKDIVDWTSDSQPIFGEIEKVVGQVANNGGIVVNHYDINVIKNNIGGHGQLILNGSKGYNYGSITSNTENYMQSVIGNESIGYNFGELRCLWSGQYAVLGGKLYNYGKITSIAPQQATDGEMYNYGTLLSININNNSLNGVGQLGNESKIYNYGTIIGQGGQSGSIKSEVENYGLITGNGATGQSLSNSIGKNYGIIAGKFSTSQSGEKNSYIYNYGIISSQGDIGQSTNESIGKNYGLITIIGDSFTGQSANNNSEIYNYGIILKEDKSQMSYAQSKGMNIGENSKGYNYGIILGEIKDGMVINSESSIGCNYGIIANDDTLNNIQDESNHNINAIDGKAFNYGILINHRGVASAGNVINNGIIIAVDSGTGEMVNGGVNNGVIYKDNSVTVGVDTENLADSKKISETSKNNIFINNLDKDSNVTLTVDKDILDNKHITAIFGKESKSDTAVKTKDDLTLNNSTIIGYFEKNGTLLEVKGDLTLSGNSIINAITGNEYTGYKGNALNNVVAVKLSDNGTLTIGENSKVLGLVQGNGTAVLKDSKEYHDKGFDVKELEIKTTQEKGTKTTVDKLKVTNGVVIAGSETSKENTKITFGNNINITGGIGFNEHGTGENLGADITLGDGQVSSDKTINIDCITLGTGDDILTINNVLEKVGVIDGNGGKDIVNLKNLNGTHDSFDYQLKNIDTLDLNNHTWKIGENANISHDTTAKAGEKTTIQNGTLMGELKGTAETSAEFVNKDNVNNVLGNSTFGENAKFQMNIGKDMKLEAGAEYNLDDTTKNNLENIKDNIVTSAIFTKATEQGKDIRVKSAKEMNIDERYSGIYEEMLKNASSNSEILDTLNESDVSSIANAINGKGVLGDTLATTGYKITRDISNSFMSAVNEWGKKADKGEWLTNAKYISSDVEYDGANNVKGYDSDINSMIGMIEYGVSENTAYGIALGGGDTEIDVKDAGTLKGDNYYIGAYAKHSVNGFDLVGNLGYTISDLEVNGEGSADSSAITFGGYIKKDVALTETVRIEPNFSFTYDYIMQDNGEGNGVKVDNKDIHVFEASAGMNIVKGFNLETGVLEIKAGAKYSMADINRNEETIISVYGIDDINLGSPEVDKTRGTANIGFDYEHNSGFGVNGKYEMMWSDSGDDSRITAGISYRF